MCLSTLSLSETLKQIYTGNCSSFAFTFLFKHTNNTNFPKNQMSKLGK